MGESLSPMYTHHAVARWGLAMRWAVIGAPEGPDTETAVRSLTTGQEGWARLARSRTGYRIDGAVRAWVRDADGHPWRVVLDRSPELEPPP